MPKHYSVRDQRRITRRDWLAVLPWDMIYALGFIVLIAILTLISFGISQLF